MMCKMNTVEEYQEGKQEIKVVYRRLGDKVAYKEYRVGGGHMSLRTSMSTQANVSRFGIKTLL